MQLLVSFDRAKLMTLTDRAISGGIYKHNTNFLVFFTVYYANFIALLNPYYEIV
jgi:hypothetical protein